MNFKQRKLPYLLVLCTTALAPLWCAAQTAAPAGPIEIGDAKMRLRLSPGGALLGLEDRLTKTQLLSPGASPLAWKMAADEPAGVKESTDRDYGPPTVRRESNAATFTWRKANQPSVIGKVWFDAKAQQFHFSSTVANTATNGVRGITFPAALSVDDAPGNYLVVSNDDQFNSPVKPLSSLKPFQVMYPGYLFMQMAGFKVGPSSLLIYTNDDKAQVKWMTFAHDNNAVQLNLMQQIRLKPGQSWNAPYSVVLKPIPGGTYNELATTYGAWGRQQWWAKTKLTDKIKRTPMLKRFFENGLVRMNAGPPVADSSSYRQDENKRWHYIEGGKYAKYEPYYQNIIDSIETYQKVYGFQPGYWTAMWTGYQFDYQYPDYFPVAPYMGDFDKFHQQISDRGYPILYHMNTAQWDSGAPTAQQKKYLAVTEKGYPYLIPFTWSKITSVLASPGVALPVEMKTVDRLADKVGVNGIYLDVIGHAFATDDNPLSPFYGQPNDYQLQKKLLFESVRKAVSGPVMTEGRNEIELPYMDMGTGANGNADSDEVPLWELVYGDCAATTTYAASTKRTRYYTWLLGGVQNTLWDWPNFDGKQPVIFVTAAQQKVISQVVPERMVRFDQLGQSRLSQWRSGAVLWNKSKTGTPEDHTSATTLGKLSVRQLSPEGIVVLNAKGDFSIDGAQEVQLNGKAIYRCTSPLPISVTRAAKRWVIHNEHKQPVEATISIPATSANLAALRGKQVVSGQLITITPTRQGNFATIQVKLPAAECLALEQ